MIIKLNKPEFTELCNKKIASLRKLSEEIVAMNKSSIIQLPESVKMAVEEKLQDNKNLIERYIFVSEKYDGSGAELKELIDLGIL